MAEGYWNGEKKQARQKKEYPAIVDEGTGEVRRKEAERDVVYARPTDPPTS